VDIRQSQSWSKYLAELGWLAESLPLNRFAYVKPVPLLGSIIKIPRCPLPIPFKEIDAVAKKHKAIFVKIEPEIETSNPHTGEFLKLLKNKGFVKDSWSLNPTKTIQINLAGSEDELLKSFEKDTRYSVNLAQRKGVRIEETDDLEEFEKIYFETAQRKGFWPAKKELEALWRVFKKENKVVLLKALYNNEPLAFTMLLLNDTTASYYHAASLDKHREVLAPYLLLWEAARFSKNKGCEILDLEGIKDERFASTKKWGGFTLFKKGFGGKEVEYLGSFTKCYNLWYRVLFFFSRF